MIERFQGNPESVRTKLNQLVDAVNQIMNIRVDRFISREWTAGGLVLQLRLDEVAASLPRKPGGVAGNFEVLVKANGTDSDGFPLYDLYALGDTAFANKLNSGDPLAPKDSRARVTSALTPIAAVDGTEGAAFTDADGNIQLDSCQETVCAEEYSAGPHGEMYAYDNTVPCLIDTTNVYHAVYTGFGGNDGTLPPNNDTSSFTYLAGTTATISAFANSATLSAGTTIVTTSAPHTLSAGEPITITGTTNYNGTYSVNAYDTTHILINKAYVSNDATGSLRRPATLRALVAGTYRASFNISGIAANNNDVFKFELNRDLTEMDNIGARIIMTSGANNFRACAASGGMALTVGAYVWLSVKNYSGTGDVTLYQADVFLNMV